MLGLAATRENVLRYLRHMHHSHEAGPKFVPVSGTRGCASTLVLPRGFCGRADSVGTNLTGVLWDLSFFVSLPNECISRFVI